MDSTEFKNFMHAQVKEIQAFIKANGGFDPDQSLAIEWTQTCSEEFRTQWDASNLETELPVLRDQFSVRRQDQSSISSF
jgi:hypothetical protein